MVGPVSVGWIKLEALGNIGCKFALKGLILIQRQTMDLPCLQQARSLERSRAPRPSLGRASQLTNTMLVADSPSNHGRFCVFCIQPPMLSTTFSSMPSWPCVGKDAEPC